MPQHVPRLRTGEEAEAFLEQDLSDLDFSQFKPVHFEFEPKTAQLNMRLPQSHTRCAGSVTFRTRHALSC
jgi:predicted DNA binding CopG/RHH family protein